MANPVRITDISMLDGLIELSTGRSYYECCGSIPKRWKVGDIITIRPGEGDQSGSPILYNVTVNTATLAIPSHFLIKTLFEGTVAEDNPQPGNDTILTVWKNRNRVSQEARDFYPWAKKRAMYITAPKLFEHDMGKKPYLNDKVRVIFYREFNEVGLFVGDRKLNMRNIHAQKDFTDKFCV